MSLILSVVMDPGSSPAHLPDPGCPAHLPDPAWGGHHIKLCPRIHLTCEKQLYLAVEAEGGDEMRESIPPLTSDTRCVNADTLNKSTLRAPLTKAFLLCCTPLI